ncbi:MAG: hypothetical protein OXI43_00485 [Candidatus Poribacteria bacterium]|nr:hypothetical protein [Candidatus Poribacteria bacterium]
MDNQEFQKLILNWMERVDGRLERMDNRLESFDGRLERFDSRLGSLEQDVSWIKGKIEGRSESSSTHRANLAIGN